MIISCSPAEKKRGSFFEFSSHCTVRKSWFWWSTLPPFEVRQARAIALISEVWFELTTLFERGSALDEPRKPVLNDHVNLNWLMGHLINLIEPRPTNRALLFSRALALAGISSSLMMTSAIWATASGCSSGLSRAPLLSMATISNSSYGIEPVVNVCISYYKPMVCIDL